MNIFNIKFDFQLLKILFVTYFPQNEIDNLKSKMGAFFLSKMIINKRNLMFCIIII